jgi:hypothetical protein
MSPRPIVNTQAEHVYAGLDLRVAQTRDHTARAPGSVDLNVRSPRYRAMLAQLDTGHLQPAELAGAMEVIAAEFAPGQPSPLGLVSQCYLGPPYQVHILDLVGQIVEHYEHGKPMPHPFERARRLASHPAYLAVEVYEDVLACIRADGSVTQVRPADV